MATDPDKDEFLEDEGQDELARPSIFSAGWFRALLVLTVLAIVVVVSLPYLLNWLEPTSAPPAGTQAKSSGPAPAPPPPAKAEAPAPAPPAAKPEAPKSTPAPVPAPATSSPAERPLATAPPTAKRAPAAQPAPAVKPERTVQPEAPKAAPAPKRSLAAEGGSPGGYWVQVGAFLEARNAEVLAKQVRGENFPVQVSQVTRGGGRPTYHLVRVGGYPDRAKAQQARGELEAKGHPGFLTQGAAR